MGVARDLLLCVIAAAVFSGAANANALCDVSYSKRADLRTNLKLKRAKLFRGHRIESAFLVSSDRLTLWWTTLPRSKYYPAAACAQKRRTDQALVAIPV